MKFRKLGRTQLEVSEVGFGAWAIGGGWGPQSEADSVAALNRALDLGVNFIDTAAGYGDGKSERIIAGVLKGRRESVVVATKTPPAPGPGPRRPTASAAARYSEKHLRENVEQRLRNLGTDRIDLLQLHTWTRAWNRNPGPFEVLRRLKEEGKVRFVGVSTPEHDQNSVIGLMRDGWVDVVQVIYNIFEQEPAAELLPAAAETGVGIIVRVVFDEGSLTGKWNRDTTFRRATSAGATSRGTGSGAPLRAPAWSQRQSRAAATRFPRRRSSSRWRTARWARSSPACATRRRPRPTARSAGCRP
jgi:aryl-alcohol dehydrogenase-like predicted oxidoreductase